MMKIYQKHDRKRRSQAKIITGFACNNRCIFCFDRINSDIPERTTGQILRDIHIAKINGYTDIHFLGGEPTIRSDFLELIACAKNQGFERIAVTSNARMFAYKNFVKDALNAGLNQFILSIHGHDAKTHDILTSCKGSFTHLLDGIENLKTCGVKNIGTNTTIVKQNYIFIKKIADFLIQEEIHRAEFIYVAATPDNFKTLTPKISQVAPLICKAFDRALKAGYFWRIQNPPMLCHFGPFTSHVAYAGLNEHCLFSNNRVGNLYRSVQELKKLSWLKIAACRGCVHIKLCLGISKAYMGHYGYSEIKPCKKI